MLPTHNLHHHQIRASVLSLCGVNSSYLYISTSRYKVRKVKGDFRQLSQTFTSKVSGSRQNSVWIEWTFFYQRDPILTLNHALNVLSEGRRSVCEITGRRMTATVMMTPARTSSVCPPSTPDTQPACHS